MILDKIVKARRITLNEDKQRISEDTLISSIGLKIKKNKDFYNAIKGKKKISIIAEVKKASPSKGVICEDFYPVKIAKEYCSNGASAISVLTERDFFKGSDEYLKNISEVVNIPVLRKDFIIDRYQIFQAKNIGADAILLIASILEQKELKEFYNIATELGLNCLVEAHNEEEIKKALSIDAKIIGINNRNLKTFDVDIKNTETLIKIIPEEKVIVSESGFFNSDDIKRVQTIGVDAVLIGEALMKSDDISSKLMDLKS